MCMSFLSVQNASLICRYGHIYRLAQEQKKGVDSVEGCEGILYQVLHRTKHMILVLRAEKHWL